VFHFDELKETETMLPISFGEARSVQTVREFYFYDLQVGDRVTDGRMYMVWKRYFGVYTRDIGGDDARNND
jgi:hypothetical protein